MKKVVTCIMAVLCSLFLVKPALAETNTVSVLFQVNYLDGVLEQYKEQQALKGERTDVINVYVQDLDKNTIYEFPITEGGNYEGRFDLPVGNYKVIDPPDLKENEIFASDGVAFNISNDSTGLVIPCLLHSKEDEEAIKNQTEKQTDNPTEGKAENNNEPANNTVQNNANETNTQETDEGFHLSLANIITIIVVVICFGIWVFHRIKTKVDASGKDFFD